MGLKIAYKLVSVQIMLCPSSIPSYKPTIAHPLRFIYIRGSPNETSLIPQAILAYITKKRH